MIPTGPLIRRRLAVLMALFFILFMVLSGRLFQIQVLDAASLQRRAQGQWTSASIVSPKRGTIMDRNGQVLAVSASAYTLSVNPRQVDDPLALAHALSPVLDMELDTLIARVSDKSKGGVTLKRQLRTEITQQLRTMMDESAKEGSKLLNGLYLEQDTKRYYPLGEFASQLLGLTTVDGTGQSGLEATLDKYLSGKAGRVVSEVDGKGRQLAYSAREYVAPQDGGEVTLTLDYVIQSFVEKAAREALSANRAQSVRILVMNPKTGEILAMTGKPDYDPNDPPRNDVAKLTDLMRNRIVTDAYEPGSTFKILTTAAALDAKVTNPNEGFYCSGTITVDGDKIHCWGNPHHAETMAKGLGNSCNPVFVELALRLGVNRFYDYLEAFGLGKPTGVEISGEAGGLMIAEDKVKRVDLARIGFGQSVAVTPIQLLTAACAAINGGNLMKPFIVKEVTDREGNVIERGRPQVVGNPITPETSATVLKLLEQVVKDGGGKNAYIEGYRIAGKTGTAQVYRDGRVVTDTHIGSFIGFAPVEDPQVAVMVIVDEAQLRPDFGSVTAAPYARDILEQTLKHLGVAQAPDAKAKQAVKAAVPDLTGMQLKDAQSLLKTVGLGSTLSGAGGRVVEQLPAPGAEMPEGSLVMLYMDGDVESGEDNRVSVPDLTGMSIVEANRMLKSHGLSLVIEGSGLAVRQTPPAGERVTPSAQVTVVFEAPG